MSTAHAPTLDGAQSWPVLDVTKYTRFGWVYVVTDHGAWWAHRADITITQEDT